VGLCGAVAFAFALLADDESLSRSARQTARPGRVERDVVGPILAELRRTWHPPSRAKVVERARGMLAALGPQLLRALANPQGELRTAIELAAALRPEGAAVALRGLANARVDAATRAEALRAANAIEPTPTAELQQFLSVTTPGVVQMAALEALAGRPDLPVTDVAELLASDDLGVRAAASKALPATLPPEVREIVRGALREGAATMELGARPGAGADDLVLGRLAERDPTVQVVCLRGLREVPAAPSGAVVDAVRHLAFDAGEDTRVRAHAFLCLERWNAFDADVVAVEASTAAPLVRWAAARCLLAAGRREGVQIWIDLIDLDASAFEPLPEPEAHTLQFSVRKTLAQLSGTSPTAGPDAWQRWLDSGATLSQRGWEPPPVALSARP
jgi:hypothetical protein